MHPELDPNAHEFAIHGLGNLFQLAGRNVHRVRIELVEHVLDGPVQQAVGVHLVHVFVLDVIDQSLDLSLLGRSPEEGDGLLLVVQGSPEKDAQGYRSRDDQGQEYFCFFVHLAVNY